MLGIDRYAMGLADFAQRFASNSARERGGHHGIMVVAGGPGGIGNDDEAEARDETPSCLDVGAERPRRR